MSSSARDFWDTKSTERLGELETIHQRIRGLGRGRRWYTTELNRSLFVALVAQFQSYCRNLHDEAVSVYLSEADPRTVPVLRAHMTKQRQLDTKNPRGGALGSDFAKVGLDLYPALKASGAWVKEDLKRLEVLVDFRNAVSHGKESEIAKLTAGGEIRATLAVLPQYRKTVERLVIKMDIVVAQELSNLLEIQSPW